MGRRSMYYEYARAIRRKPRKTGPISPRKWMQIGYTARPQYFYGLPSQCLLRMVWHTIRISSRTSSTRPRIVRTLVFSGLDKSSPHWFGDHDCSGFLLIRVITCWNGGCRPLAAYHTHMEAHHICGSYDMGGKPIR